MIIHGSYGHPELNWFPWLKRELEAAGHRVLVPTFPTPGNQSAANWKKVFDAEAGPLDADTVLVGHSVGAGFVLTLLDDKDARQIKSAYLIAGFLGALGLPDFDPINETFVSRDFQSERIKNNCRQITLINSDNDPYVPMKNAQALADLLTLPIELVPGGGHLNGEAGYTTFPLLLTKIQGLPD